MRNSVVAGLSFAFVAGGVAAYLAMRQSPAREVVVLPAPAAKTTVAVARDAAPVMTPDRSDEPLTSVAAASDAPVIAVASENHVWISRDDGATFAPALAGSGSVAALFVDTGGQVYVHRLALTETKGSGVTYVGSRDQLGVADLDGHERWHELADNIAPADVHAGTVIGVGGAGGVVRGRDGGAAWSDVPGAAGWNPWRVAIGDDVRVLASRIGKDDAIESGLSVLAGDPLHPVWTTPARDAFGVPSEGAPCGAFVGSTLYLVTTARARGERGTQLVTVDAKGAARTTTLADLVGGIKLAPDLMKCQIAGNAHAAYLTTDKIIFRIDGAKLSLLRQVGSEADQIAVDRRGNLLALGQRCVQRIHPDSSQIDEVVCGRPR